MLTVIGWLACGVILLYATVAVLFLSFTHLAPGLLEGKWYERVVAILLMLACTIGWYKWFSVISINL